MTLTAGNLPPVAPQFEDEFIVCKDCGTPFLWKAGEKAFFFSKGLKKPVRCSACRQHLRNTISVDRRWANA